MQKYLLISSVIILFICVYFFFLKPTGKTDTSQIKLGDTTYNLEIAKTMAQKAQGLSNRPNLCEKCGMIFIFGQDGSLPFWMKDTLIPLDMIWLDSSGKIVSFETALPEPNTSMTKLKIYKNSSPAKYVIELNANHSQKLGLKIGDILDISNFQ